MESWTFYGGGRFRTEYTRRHYDYGLESSENNVTEGFFLAELR